MTTDVSLAEIHKAMRIWWGALAPYPIHASLVEQLVVASTVSREHFDATALWLFDMHEIQFIEAIALARQLNILRTWDDVETS